MGRSKPVQDAAHRCLPRGFLLRRSIESDWLRVPPRTPALICSLADQLLTNEWCDPTDIRRRQREQVRRLLAHAAQSPFHSERMRAASLDPRTIESTNDLQRLPIMTRTHLQHHFSEICVRRLPRGVRFRGDVITSGTTGKPVKVRTTDANALLWAACATRHLVWSGIDPQGRLAIIRRIAPERIAAAHSNDGGRLPNWGWPIGACFVTGPAYAMDIGKDIKTQMDFLRRTDPDCLLSYPSNLLGMAGLIEDGTSGLPRLKAVHTLGEAMSMETRGRIEVAFGVPVFDMYTCAELGYVASQCPAGEGYHVYDENVFLEILDDDDRPCEPGKVGRVVLTGLFNAGFPLIRYDLGDLAVAAEPGRCRCGRGLTRLTEIVGRSSRTAQPANGS